MSYTRTNWVNNTSPYINEDNLNKMENGIFEAHNMLDDIAVSVKSFGAVGDGNIDDTLAFKRAVDELNQTGGNLYIPAGTYKLTDTIQVGTFTDKPVSIIGEGIGLTLIKWSGGSKTVFRLGNDVFMDNPKVQNIQIDMSSSVSNGSAIEMTDGIQSGYIKSVKITKCFIGIFVRGTGIRLSDVSISDLNNNGIGIKVGRSIDVFIDNCTINGLDINKSSTRNTIALDLEGDSKGNTNAVWVDNSDFLNCGHSMVIKPCYTASTQI